MQLVFSPLHSTNRIPLGNDDFPIKLPVYPNPKSIYPLSGKPYEIGLQSTYLQISVIFQYHISQPMIEYLIYPV